LHLMDIRRRSESLREAISSPRRRRPDVARGYPDRAIVLYTKARATLAARLGPDHLETPGSMPGLANGYEAAGWSHRALELRGETLALMRAKLGPDHPGLVLDVDAALERLAREDPSSAEVARHRLFAGLSIDEVAEAMGLSRATAFREWAYARSW